MKEKKLRFIDLEFLPNDQSLGINQEENFDTFDSYIQWSRVEDIANYDKLMLERTIWKSPRIFGTSLSSTLIC